MTIGRMETYTLFRIACQPVDISPRHPDLKPPLTPFIHLLRQNAAEPEQTGPDSAGPR